MPETKRIRKPVEDRLAIKIAKRDELVSRFERLKAKLDNDIQRLNDIKNGVVAPRMRKEYSEDQMKQIESFMSLSDEERQSTLQELKEKARIMRLAEKLRKEDSVRKTEISEVSFEESDDDDDDLEDEEEDEDDE